jgi:GNAT superfamily N-acetyltransferase
MKDEVPIGDVVYEKDGYAIHKIDGEEHKVWHFVLHLRKRLRLTFHSQLYAQNLSLFAKLFLDTKSVFFDVSSFLYYLLVQQQPASSSQQSNGASALPQSQVVGFYSKEKMSWDNNNLACILVFPPWQRKGLGQLLMGASYVLGRREGRFGGPEKPLSAKGLKGYLAYWCREVARFIVDSPGKKTVSIKTVSDGTWIMPEDVVVALKEMGCLEARKTASGSLVVNKSRVREWAEKHRILLAPVVDVEAFVEAEESELSDVEESSEGEKAEESA